MKLKYRQAAIFDIQNTCGYIRDHLKNPQAAKNLKTRLLNGASLLKNSPYRGIAMDSKYDGFDPALRFLVVSKQLIFYEVHDDLIEIIRVLDGRSDYLAHLLD